MASSPSGPATPAWLQRTTSVLEFAIGIFGAMAIIGVFFKIQKYDNYELYMALGFLGEAAAFVIMGLFSLLSGFFIEKSSFGQKAEDSTQAATGEELVVRERDSQTNEVTASFREMMEEKVNDDLNVMMGALAQEVRRFGEEMHGMSAEMERTRGTLGDMRGDLEHAVDGSLAEETERFGDGLSKLGGEMNGASEAVHRMRTDLDEIAARFKNFNGDMAGVSSNGGANGQAVHSSDGSMA